MSSPKVIFNCKFTHAFNRSDAHYTEKQIEGLKKKIARKFDYFSNEEKRVMNLFDYYTGNLNKNEAMNLVIENGSYATKDEIEKRKKRFVKYAEKSNLWQGVISFNNDYLTQNITLEDLEKEMVKTILPKFFKKMGFKDINKMAYNLSLHTDTDNLHIHFSFIEKEPNYICANKKLSYRRKGQLSQEEIDFLKNEVVITVERNQFLTPMITVTNEEIDKLKRLFNPKEKNFILYDKKDLLLEEKLLHVGKLLYEDRKDKNKKIKFNSLRNEEIKTLVKDIKKYLFVSKSEFYEDYINLKKSLDDINDYLYRVNIDNNVTNINIDKSFINYKKEYADNYILNAIVNHSNYFFKENSKRYHTLNENDILEEIFIRIYEKNKNQTKFNILQNYLSNTSKTNKFKNRYQVIKAIKHINEEMEEAKKEFSKLFENDNTYSKNN